MLKLFTTRSYQDRVDSIYKEIQRNPWLPLRHLELCMRRIHILNSKIKNLSADMGREKGKYDTL